MFRNKVVGFSMVCMLFPAAAQMMTVTEVTLKQSEIARAELDSRLSDIRNKNNFTNTAPVAVRTAPTLADKDADEVLSLVSVYGVGTNLKADFLFRGTVVTLEAGGKTEAAGWRVEKLSQTEAVLVRVNKGKVIKRNTVYLSSAALFNGKPGDRPGDSMPLPAANPSATPAPPAASQVTTASGLPSEK